MSFKRIFSVIFLFLLFSAASVFGQPQQHSKGAILDEDAYNKLPRKATLATRSYEGLPKSFSLKQYSPIPGDQSDYGTCVAWASAYAARTISESVALNRRNQTETTQNVFSPVYVYRTINPNDPECQRGSEIYTALDLLRDSGAVRMLDIERTLSFSSVDISNYRESRKYPIGGYVTLFSREDKQKPALITRIVKKSLTEGKPVVIGMNTPNSFIEAKNIWKPTESPGRFYGGHAMCVIGYDDDKGAFEIINSWGRKWGNGGFIWIPYKTFVDFVVESYEMIENLAIFSDAVKYEGSGRIEIISRGAARTAALTLTQEGYYKTSEAFTQGTQFRFIVGASENAYVYSFAVSQPARNNNFYSPALLFPPAGVSPLLNYRDSAVAIPAEDNVLELDAESGMEYIITLYSKQPLEIQLIMRRFISGKGNIKERLTSALGSNNLLSPSYKQAEASFSVTTDDSRAVAALIVAVEHK